MTLAHHAPALAVCALLAVAAVLLLREGHRTRHRPGCGRVRPHSRWVGTARQDHDAIKEHDMDRIYMNRIPGSERIHIEIAANEVADLLDDLPAEDPEWFDATKKLRAILAQADKDFHHTRWNNAANATEEPTR